jgi:hypothetical protein
MLNPNVQKKGGFSAFAERDQERRDARAARAATVSPAASEAVSDAASEAVSDAHPPVAPSARPEKTLDRSQPLSD